MTLAELGLTPTQFAEVDALESAFVAAWLTAVSEATAVKNRAAWFLAGIRTGRLPHEAGDAAQAQAVHRAERWLANVGALVDEAEALDELYGPHGVLRGNSDEALRERLLERWRAANAR